ncbi:hypothetical protein GCM10009525_59180 [Streptosporangium amethystogenes subsp. fukuiense]
MHRISASTRGEATISASRVKIPLNTASALRYRQWVRWAGARVSLISSRCSVSTLVSDIHWIFDHYTEAI